MLEKEAVMARNSEENDKRGLALIRNFENRIVWLACFLVNKPKSLSSAAAKAADEGLDEYQRRFPQIAPHELPDG